MRQDRGFLRCWGPGRAAGPGSARSISLTTLLHLAGCLSFAVLGTGFAPAAGTEPVAGGADLHPAHRIVRFHGHEIAAGPAVALAGRAPAVRTTAGADAVTSAAAAGFYLLPQAAGRTLRTLEAAGWSVVAPASGADGAWLVTPQGSTFAPGAGRARSSPGSISAPDAVALAPAWKRTAETDGRLGRASAEVALVIEGWGDPATAIGLLRSHGLSPTETVVGNGGAATTGRAAGGRRFRLGVRGETGRVRAAAEHLAEAPDAGVYSLAPGRSARLLNATATTILQSGKSTGSRPFWDAGFRGAGQVIAVLDTGIQYDECVFMESTFSRPPLAIGTEVGTPDRTRRKIIIYDLLYPPDQDAGPTDFDNQGHGTLCASVAAGMNPLLGPVPSWQTGVAPEAQLIAQDAGTINADSCADLPALGCPLVDLTAVLDQAYAQGARIHSNSWGDREEFAAHNTYTAISADMDDAVARHRDFVIVCAGGNDGPVVGSVHSPGTAKNVLSIGATSSPSFSGSTEDTIAFFSSYGYADDGRIKPDLLAPGQVSTASSSLTIGLRRCESSLFQGTSASCPAAAGAVALVRSYFEEGWYPAGAKGGTTALVPSAALVKAVLICGARPVSSSSLTQPGREQGWGQIDLSRSLPLGGTGFRLFVINETIYFDEDSSTTVEIPFRISENPAAIPLRITLAYTDAPAAPNQVGALVNDIDMTLFNADTGTEYIANRFDAGRGDVSGSLSSGAPDSVNNVEQIRIRAGNAVGNWVLRLRPTRILVGPQPVALAMRGPLDSGLFVLPDYQNWIAR